MNHSVNGVFPAVCIDVIHQRYAVDHVLQSFVTLVFSVDAPGRPHTLVSAKFPFVLTQGSRLRSILETWRGAPFTDDHIDAFDVDHCVGVGARLRVQSHRNSHGRISAQWHQATPLSRSDTPAPPPDYIRQHHRAVA